MAKGRIKYLLLLLLNIVLYGLLGKNIIFFLITLVYTYLFANILFSNKKKILLVIFIIFTIFPLILFKYLNNFLNISMLVPLGISYYTLTCLSFLIDNYQSKYKKFPSFLDYALYISYFPTLFIGPINRYKEFKSEIENIGIKKENIFPGFLRISVGLIKKYIIANKLNVIIIFLNSHLDYQGGYVLLGLIIYFIMLYCDFSGGIDIVLGISKCFNVNLCENFNRPYLSVSVKDFWRRWHISLGSWLKDYVYIPLGGNRKGLIRSKINIVITFLVSGLWHGINYLLWGLINGILVSFSKETKYHKLNIFITFVLISCLWIFFIYPDTLTALKMFMSIFTKFDLTFIKNVFTLGLNIYDYIVIFLMILLVLFYEAKKNILDKKINTIKLEYQLMIILSLIFIVLLFGSYGLDVNSSNFIYGNF